ncbi:HD domain-containing protein [Anaerolineales bacterium HSG25]|nr:HD domain-containing protein [Anaerolineales bacterium HSG25]
MLTIDQAKPLYKNDAAHDFDHILRVLANAQQIGQAENADMAILQTAVLLHDIARADQERTGEDHAVIGAQRAKQILTDLNYKPDFIQAVYHAIVTHRFRIDAPPTTLEAKILYDADKLDSIGAIGMARVFAYSGHANRSLWRDNTDEHTALQEYQHKLVKIKDSLFTVTARQIAIGRHRFMAEFVEQIIAEIQGVR